LICVISEQSSTGTYIQQRGSICDHFHKAFGFVTSLDDNQRERNVDIQGNGKVIFLPRMKQFNIKFDNHDLLFHGCFVATVIENFTIQGCSYNLKVVITNVSEGN
jgi:hypothetical protein